ncbi:hypothetical protein SEVIR_2G199900v4 [Setaria viridis]|uniref:Protein kinase domain-containing protein n=1 Tax=Setaria viridis TaxID=4556 RepID=A0A4U6W608_SETVI|nr:probable inactive receptor kinase At2g26730 [Setaria viridis]TKW32946.1 hypothetical protein SEVIR_2G199900v2 [Setaria viridis]TKW32947.1 hypothetical protein SEVIR_2G199900v2 [Setaria viridis]
MAKLLPALAAALVALLAGCSCGVRGGESPEARESLVQFLTALAGGDGQAALRLGWDASVDPCAGTDSSWGDTIKCFENKSENVGKIKKIVLDGKGLSGTIDAALLCAAPAVRVVQLPDNSLRGGVPAGISACSGLTQLIVSGNQLSGSLPPSLAQLGKLEVLDVSRNNFSGEIPGGLSKLGELVRFVANDNHFNGTIPDFDLDKFQNFTVSTNNITGPIPKNAERFGNDSFWPNAAGMCGRPFFDPCPSSPTTAPFNSPSPSSVSEDEDGQGEENHKKRTVPKIVMYLGYVLLGAAILAFVLYKICSKKKRSKLGRKSKPGGGRGVYDSSRLTTTTTTTSVSPSKSAYSLPTSVEQSAAGAPPSASLVVLRRSGTASITSNAAAEAAKELRFEDLLKSPAELLGRGRFGSSYKVVVPNGAALAVKRVKDAAVDEEAFRRRMERVASAKHPAVLPPLAFYCAMQEKLVVYEFQSNGSLAKLLHGSIESSQGPLDWPARLHIAAKVADGMAFMHTALGRYGASSNSSTSGEEAAADGPIAHGNLKASNVLFTAGMDPCISEYGVTAAAPPASRSASAGAAAAALRADVRAFGVLLLELLTGKATSERGDGAELARWVTSVIREEWTAEVFDRALLAGGGDGSSEQRMLRLLQVAMRCVDASPGSAPPPTMREAASMINAIREEDDRSFSLEA